MPIWYPRNSYMGDLPSLESLNAEQQELLRQIQPFIDQYKSQILTVYKNFAKASADYEAKKFKKDSILTLYNNELQIDLIHWRTIGGTPGLNTGYYFGLDYGGGPSSDRNFDYETSYQQSKKSNENNFPNRDTDAVEASRYNERLKAIEADYWLFKQLADLRAQYHAAKDEYLSAEQSKADNERALQNLRSQFDTFFAPYKDILSGITFDSLLEAAKKEDQVIPQVQEAAMTIPDVSTQVEPTPKKSPLPWIVGAGILAKILLR